MKKILSILLLAFLFTGCLKMKATPTTEVEDFFAKYQQLDSVVISQLNEVINKDTNLTSNQRKAYRDAIERQYRNLKYEIKEERVDGDVATVTAEIEVFDYHKALTAAQQYLTENPDQFTDEEDVFDESKYFDYKVQQMADTTDKVTYTLDLTLIKQGDKWVLEDLTDTDREKIHGLYNYS
ncbi:MAG: hypothetical protein ACOXZS_01580 [Bacilli bacterium]